MVFSLSLRVSIQVQISETADGRVMVRDLSLHEAPTEQQALELLKKVIKIITRVASSDSPHMAKILQLYSLYIKSVK